ncbi:MAG: hypothetical protein HFI85_01015 [Clostridia bacterium]|nr:hypothetical protein [Clostridia bacterium]
MAENKQTLKYRINKEYLKNCTIARKADINTNQVKFFSVNANKKVKEDLFDDIEMF